MCCCKSHHPHIHPSHHHKSRSRPEAHLLDILGVHKRHNPVQINLAPQLVVHPENGGDGSWVRQPSRLKEDVIEPPALEHQVLNRLDSIISG
ncbi:hypothetical protein BC936DRAFT_143362 [Jimgerdemannia flammicorona]|uniref:Uncharacterized protein n=2 Tax=Jimgerdemannia flammicorona TaxID=994334 RepID=A0A433DE16_9FUNG|nr:hypothetical protein BC936DRAFT_143362 [Jimgerdemannia flammicorona]RUS34700.1 hypothetical protein BC938DRAFT_479081 [Jimgerdemannia flammicorona]